MATERDYYALVCPGCGAFGVLCETDHAAHAAHAYRRGPVPIITEVSPGFTQDGMCMRCTTPAVRSNMLRRSVVSDDVREQVHGYAKQPALLTA